VTRKRRRMNFIVLGLLTLGLAAALVLTALEDKIVFFYSPTDIAIKKQVPTKQQIRIGGLVKEGTWEKPTNDLTHKFTVTDLRHDISISYKGIIPDIFREGQGVVVLGKLQTDGNFQADEVLAKHDEKYMPPEVADALKNSGKWKQMEDAK
jgi:cytochrome c-type biogenesis protein CcmE